MPQKKKWYAGLSQLLIPLVALGILILFNLFRDPSFFRIQLGTNKIGPVFTGNIISIIDSASELAIIAMGMTLVTAACGGQDISVGCVGAIAGAIFVQTLMRLGDITGWTVLVAFLACCAVTIVFKLFNGTLVAVFKIQPMIATLILFSSGRSIAYLINGSPTVPLEYLPISIIGFSIPGVPIPTPVLITALMGLLLFLFSKFSNIRLHTQAVGINVSAARLNGVRPVLVKLLSFVILGVCVAAAAVIGVARMNSLTPKTLLADIEMDAILAVAIGGNSLGGGKFRYVGSVLGAYTIQTLYTTLNAMNVETTDIKAYKAIVILIIVVAGSPAIRSRIAAFRNRRNAAMDMLNQGGGAK